MDVVHHYIDCSECGRRYQTAAYWDTIPDVLDIECKCGKFVLHRKSELKHYTTRYWPGVDEYVQGLIRADSK